MFVHALNTSAATADGLWSSIPLLFFQFEVILWHMFSYLFYLLIFYRFGSHATKLAVRIRLDQLYQAASSFHSFLFKVAICQRILKKQLEVWNHHKLQGYFDCRQIHMNTYKWKPTAACKCRHYKIHYNYRLYFCSALKFLCFLSFLVRLFGFSQGDWFLSAKFLLAPQQALHGLKKCLDI